MVMEQQAPEKIVLSVIIPVYNELDNLDALQSELETAIHPLNIPYEIIYINDGSRDGSDKKLEEISQQAPEVIFIDLRRNFGQTAAMAAGIEHASGDVIILMDADLQNDPANIKDLLAKIDEGYDVVSGWRKDRKDRMLTRRLPSVIANRLISWVTGVHLHDYGCTLKAYRREVAQEIRLYGEMHRFIPVFAAATGAEIAEIEVNHRPRIHGTSKYGLGRTFKVILDLITVKFLLSYRTTPMYLFGSVGTIFMGTGILAILAALINRWVRGISLIRTPLPQLAAMFFALGVQSILLGLTTEQLVRTYYEAQDKAIYVVRRIIKQSRED